MSNDTTDDEPAPDPDIMQYLEDRYGVDPEALPHDREEPPHFDYRIDLGDVGIEIEAAFAPYVADWGWSVYAEGEVYVSDDPPAYQTVRGACDAADETLEALNG